MNIKKKKFYVTIEKEIEVSFDQDLMKDEEFCRAHREDFYGFEEIAEHMEHIAQFYARFESFEGMDGYYGLRDYEKGFQIDAIQLSEEVDVEEAL